MALVIPVFLYGIVSELDPSVAPLPQDDRGGRLRMTETRQECHSERSEESRNVPSIRRSPYLS